MKIDIEIDDKYNVRNLYIFGGMEPIARKRRNNAFWEIKISDCSKCGKCCKIMTNEDHPFGSKEGCIYLRDNIGEYLCGLGIFRPYCCAISEMKQIEECTVKWQPLTITP